jgi:D-alanyl-D-alanine carboxypeptidase
MPMNDQHLPDALDTPVSRRALLKSAAGVGAGVLAGGLAGTVLPSAARAATPRSTGGASDLIDLFEARCKDLLVPGAMLVAHVPRVGEVVTSFGTGVLGEKRHISLNHRFRIGSVTKTMTGTLILRLAQEGRLKLSDPVATHHPGVPNGDRITIEQLLSMRSGLYDYSDWLPLNQALDAHPKEGHTPEELLKIAFDRETGPGGLHPVRGAFNYCNTNTVLLGLVAKRITGKALTTQFQELFDQLKRQGRAMDDTALPAIDVWQLPDPHSQGYMYGTNVSTLHTEKLPPDQIKAARAGTLLPNDVTDSNPSWAWAAGAAVSTADDMSVWAKALCDGSLLNEEWQRQRLDSMRPTGNGASYGLALAKFGPLYGHTGEIPGFQTFVGHDPDTSVTLVVWTNLKASPEGEPPATEIAKTLIGQIYK